MRTLNAILLLLALALLVYFVQHVGLAQIAGGFARVGWGFFLLLGCFLAAFLVETWNWSRCFRRPVGLRAVLVPAWCGSSINQLTPGSSLGELVKGNLLVGRVPTEAIVSSLVLNNLSVFYGTVVVLLVGSGGLWWLGAPAALRWASTILPAVALVVLILLHRGLVRGIVSAALRRIAARRAARGRGLPGTAPKASRLERASTQVARWEQELADTHRELPWRFAQVLAVNLVAQALPIYELWLTWRLLGVDLDLARCFTFAVVDTVVKLAFIFVPGTIGIAEGSTYLTSGLLELDRATGLTKQLIGRSVRLVFSVLGALYLAAITILGRQRRVD